jgi:hypothetical protein
VAGIQPWEFDDLTMGDIFLAIEAHHEREKNTLISRVNAVIRGLSQLGKNPTDPYKGLIEKDHKSLSSTESKHIAAVFKGAEARKTDVKAIFKKAKEAWLWRDEE